MLILRATKQLRDKFASAAPAAQPEDESTTLLGDWYANLVRWKSPVVLLVNARTFYPVFAPLAPTKGFPAWIADLVAEELRREGVPEHVIDHEHARMQEVRIAPTADRQVVGVMNEFILLAGYRRERYPDLRDLTRKTATTPVGPLTKREGFPDRELRALIAELQPNGE